MTIGLFCQALPHGCPFLHCNVRAYTDAHITRVGGTKPLQVQCRVIASTNADLAARLRLSPETGAIMDYVRREGSINNTQCRELLGVGLQRACHILRKLHRAGLLAKESSRRWTHYHLP